jgi:hypothetical protein
MDSQLATETEGHKEKPGEPKPCGRGRCTAGRGGHWQAPDTSGRYTYGQAERMWLRRATEGHGCGGTGEGGPLRATDKEEGKRKEGREATRYINNCVILLYRTS